MKKSVHLTFLEWVKRGWERLRALGTTNPTSPINPLPYLLMVLMNLSKRERSWHRAGGLL